MISDSKGAENHWWHSLTPEDQGFLHRLWSQFRVMAYGHCIEIRKSRHPDGPRPHLFLVHREVQPSGHEPE